MLRPNDIALLLMSTTDLANHHDTYLCVCVYNTYTYIDTHIYTQNTTPGTIQIPKYLQKTKKVDQNQPSGT